MKKVLIISYFFPPGNFPGSFRVKSWADNLSNFGYYPIIVTRHWDEFANDYTAIIKKEGIEKQVTEKFTVYRLPYRGSFRDKLIHKFGKRAEFVGKLLSFFQIAFQSYTLKLDPFSGLYEYSRKIIAENPDISFVITSGRPFIQFKYCWLLKREFPGISWVGDYRDAWNSSLTVKKSANRWVQHLFERKLEKKWTRNAAILTTVSNGLSEEISAYLAKPVSVIFNGFEPDEYKINPINSNSAARKVELLYSGSLYPWQPYFEFLKAYKEVSKKFENKLVLKFLGTKPTKELTFFVKENPGLEIEIIPKRTRVDAISLLKNADLLVLIGYSGRKGILSSKIFEYLGANKPIFYCATDDKELEYIIRAANVGIIAEGYTQIVEKLEELIKEKIRGGQVKFEPNEIQIAKYTRLNQTRRLAEALNKLQG